ncbi:MAG: DUF4282 domain-containing protein [Pseudonocardia sp.]|nr:DUF4282 domain-containing protein [Pseudonocardia sp.]
MLGALFDFGFNRFATPSVIKVVYIIGFVIIGLFHLFAVVAGFYRGVGLGILALVGGAVGAAVLPDPSAHHARVLLRGRPDVRGHSPPPLNSANRPPDGGRGRGTLGR